MRNLWRKAGIPLAVLVLLLLPASAHTVNTDTLNVRSGPGTSYTIVGTLKRGTQVSTSTVSGAWTKITSPLAGWVYSAYLANTPHIPYPNLWGAVPARPAEFFFPPCVNLRDTTVVIRWRTANPRTGTVSYGTTSSYGSVSRSATPGTIHKVYLDGLAPATRYFYRVAVDGTSAAMTGTFVTPGAGLTKIRAVFLGEVHYPSYVSYVAKFAPLIRKFSPHLVIESGDMMDYGAQDSNWASYMQNSTAWLPSTIFLPCHSNHVNGSGGNANLKNFFSLPNNERWYATRFGPLLNLTLDSTFELNADVGTTQISWLRSQMAAAHDGAGDPFFTTAVWHYPAYSSGPASRAGQRDWVRRNFLSTITGNGGADLVHVAHDKFTERSVINGLNHVQTNIGNLTPQIESSNPYKVYRNTATRSTLFVEFDVAARKLTGWIINGDGAILDWFVIKK